MNTFLLNVAWLIMVSLIAETAFSQIEVNTSNNAQIIINCDQLGDLAPPIAKSNCNNELHYLYVDNLFSGGCLGTIERIWTISDECDNKTTFQQFIRLTETTPPSLSNYPKDISVSIDQIPEIEALTATDNCTQKLSISVNEEKFYDENENLISIKRDWNVKDKCGNITSHTQTILILKTAL